MTINQRIAELRRALKLSQPVFASKICISKGYIANLELGQKQVNERIIRLISTTFGVREEWLRIGEEPVFYDPQNHKIEEIIRIFKNLNPFFQDLFLEHLQKVYEYENGKNKAKKPG